MLNSMYLAGEDADAWLNADESEEEESFTTELADSSLAADEREAAYGAFVTLKEARRKMHNAKLGRQCCKGGSSSSDSISGNRYKKLAYNGKPGPGFRCGGGTPGKVVSKEERANTR